LAGLITGEIGIGDFSQALAAEFYYPVEAKGFRTCRHLSFGQIKKLLVLNG
jgi:hypothetical protein